MHPSEIKSRLDSMQWLITWCTSRSIDEVSRHSSFCSIMMTSCFLVIRLYYVCMFVLQYQILMRKYYALPWFALVFSKIALCIFVTILLNYVLLIKLLRRHNPGQTLFALTLWQSECQCPNVLAFLEVIRENVTIVQHVEADHLH